MTEEVDLGIMDIVDPQESQLDMVVKPTWKQAEYVSNWFGTLGKNLNWWVGDYLHYMEDHFPETWPQLIPDVGKAEHTMQNWKWVAGKIPANERFKNLSFAHHSWVAKFPKEERDQWLTWAEEGGWSEKRLRDEIKGPPKEREPKTHKMLVQCPDCESKFDIEVDV